jgi:trehalose 6-phosphate phosphatase
VIGEGDLLRGPALVAAARAVLDEGPAGLLCDVDGTLSPIAPRPEMAVVRPRTRRALRTLARRLALLAAVSGRSADDARRLVRVPGIVYVGNHGMEAVMGRRRWTHPQAGRFRQVLAGVLRDLRIRLAGEELLYEPKGLGASIHYREAADPERTRAAILTTLGALPQATALRVTEGRLVVELRPPVAASKGTAVTCLLRRHGLRAALFLGDDRTDLDAMRALRAARAENELHTLAVAVASAEMPAELLTEADGVAEGVDAVEALLAALAASA